MLSLALPVAHQLGIEPALITCDASNKASRKVIEANGGVLFDHGQTLRVLGRNVKRQPAQLEDRTAG